jgi:thiol-disulfide isomerase/thioredoxin
MSRVYTGLVLVGALASPALADDSPTGIPNVKTIPKTKAEALAEADRLEKLYEGKQQPESVRMLIAIARGQMSGTSGWFGPAQTRYDGNWLARTCNADLKAGIPLEKFPGDKVLFGVLDRDRNGVIEATDLDWSPSNPYVIATATVNRLYRQMDPKGKGQVSKEDMIAYFEKVSKGKDTVTAEDLRTALLGGGGTYLPGDGPSTETLLRGLFASELGSLQNGPALGATAPDFELQTADGKAKMKLSSLIGKKPVVLVLGNYTCGPFRALYGEIESIKKKYGTEAEFLMVYVREAHPTDGWRMKSNDLAGVAVAQPRTDEERCGVAQQCAKTLNPTMPLVVDGVDDKVGNLYSGMPGRLYVIDREGKVAYKSGRGPYGFKAGELEQALVMALLEAKGNSKDK